MQLFGSPKRVVTPNGGQWINSCGQAGGGNLLTWLSCVWNSMWGFAHSYTILGFLNRPVLRSKSKLLSKFAMRCAASQNVCINIHSPNVCAK